MPLRIDYANPVLTDGEVHARIIARSENGESSCFELLRRNVIPPRVRRIELVAWFSVESLILGLIGSLLGLALGLGLAEVLVALVSRTINDLYYVTQVRAVALESEPLMTAAGLGITAAVMAGIAPAIRIGRQAAAQVLVGPGEPGSSESRLWITRLTVAGVSISGAAAWFLYGVLPHMAGTDLLPAFAGMFSLVCGAACLAPAAILGMLWSCARLGRPLLGVLGRLAVAQAVVS